MAALDITISTFPEALLSTASISWSWASRKTLFQIQNLQKQHIYQTINNKKDHLDDKNETNNSATHKLVLFLVAYRQHI